MWLSRAILHEIEDEEAFYASVIQQGEESSRSEVSETLSDAPTCSKSLGCFNAECYAATHEARHTIVREQFSRTTQECPTLILNSAEHGCSSL